MKNLVPRSNNRRSNRSNRFWFLFALTAALLTTTGALAHPNSRFLTASRGKGDARGPAARATLKYGAAALTPAAPSPSGDYNVSLSGATVSADELDRLIVVMDAKGDLPGALTLRLERDASGSTVTGGEWALVVAYTEEIQLSPGEGDGDAGESLVQKGTLKGTISGGLLTLNADGSLASVNSLQLTVSGGSMSYDAVADGSGSAHEENLQDAPASSGSLALSF
jgi:hypothetical protein